MARTYRKVIKLGVCSGSNTEYYRYKRRETRRKNNQNLRNLLYVGGLRDDFVVGGDDME